MQARASSSEVAGEPIFGRTRAPNEAWLAGLAPETPLEPDLPLVDAYLHFWHRGDSRYLVEEYVQDLESSGHNVISSVAVDAGAMYRASGPEQLKPVGGTEFLVGVAAMGASGKYTGSRLAEAIVALADFTLGDRVVEVLEAHQEAANGRLRGVKATAKWDPDPIVRASIGPDRPGLFLEPEFNKGFSHAVKRGLVLDASIYHPQIPDVVALARAHPDAVIALVHAGSPVGYASYGGKEAEVKANWLSSMKELARCPNVHVKLGGLLMTLANFDFIKADRPPTSSQLAELWRPYIEPCIELFGPERCMAAANYPTDKAGLQYGTVWNMFKRLTADYGPDERQLILGGTARKLYGLE